MNAFEEYENIISVAELSIELLNNNQMALKKLYDANPEFITIVSKIITNIKMIEHYTSLFKMFKDEGLINNNMYEDNMDLTSVMLQENYNEIKNLIISGYKLLLGDNKGDNEYV